MANEQSASTSTYQAKGKVLFIICAIVTGTSEPAESELSSAWANIMTPSVFNTKWMSYNEVTNVISLNYTGYKGDNWAKVKFDIVYI